jgi:hypothetical protein
MDRTPVLSFTFLPVPDEGFMEKSKHVARFGQYSTLTADTALIDGVTVYLTNSTQHSSS